MSWIKCDDCGELINSDNDPDCFLICGPAKGDEELVMCERCRFKHSEGEYAEAEGMKEPTIRVPRRIIEADLDDLDNQTCADVCGKTWESQGCIGRCALDDAKRELRKLLEQ